MYHSFLIHSSADGHLGCFHVLAIILRYWQLRDSWVRAKGLYYSWHGKQHELCWICFTFLCPLNPIGMTQVGLDGFLHTQWVVP